jgi:putative aldouronate transport system substrate-binding protein
LKLFDYVYSEEGNILMSYGPQAWRSGDMITYKGKQIPELSDAALNELWTLAGGNYTNYARMYLGSTLPIGFVKNQGMEYQCTTEGGRNGAAIVSAAIAAGTIKHVSPFLDENRFYTMVPTALPTTAQQDILISSYAAIGSSGLYSKENKKYNIYLEIIKNGFGSGVALNNTFITTMPEDSQTLINRFKELGGQAYIVVRQSAWATLETYYQSKVKE